jgi:rubrerythrin
MKRAFASLDAREALHVAIFIEERNAGLYQRFAEMFAEFRDSESLEIAGVFCEMAEEEKGHSNKLQSRYMDEFGNSNCTLTEEDLVELIEVPKLYPDDILAGEGSKRNARDRALQVALEAEQGAQRFYAELVQKTPEGPLNRLYQELVDMEGQHADYLQRKLIPRLTSDRSVS